MVSRVVLSDSSEFFQYCVNGISNSCKLSNTPPADVAFLKNDRTLCDFTVTAYARSPLLVRRPPQVFQVEYCLNFQVQIPKIIHAPN